MNVTLTFDNGPEPSVTPHVLETLERERILATFFVLGSKLADPARRKLAERAHAAGHWIGNHTMTHGTPLGKLTEAGAARREILETQKLLGELSHPDRFFRPFGGGGALGPHLLNQEALQVLQQEKMTCVLWNAIPRDFENPDGWVDIAVKQCLAQPWTLVVLHDLPNGAMKHLGPFITSLRDKGAVFHQDFPPEWVPIKQGQVIGGIGSYVNS